VSGSAKALVLSSSGARFCNQPGKYGIFLRERRVMAKLAFLLLLIGSFAVAQSDNSASTNQAGSKSSNNNGVTVRGCVDRERGDYVLIQQNPAMTYELRGSDKVKLQHYLGQRVEATGTTSTSLPTSSDSLTGSSAPSPVTLKVSSIKTLDKECTERSAR
jgi:hypothetical protein